MKRLSKHLQQLSGSRPGKRKRLVGMQAGRATKQRHKLGPEDVHPTRRSNARTQCTQQARAHNNFEDEKSAIGMEAPGTLPPARIPFQPTWYAPSWRHDWPRRNRAASCNQLTIASLISPALPSQCPLLAHKPLARAGLLCLGTHPPTIPPYGPYT